VLGDLHTNLTLSLDCFVIIVQHEQYIDIDDENLVVMHEVMLEISWLPISTIIQPKLQTNYPIMQFLAINSLKSTSSPTNLIFEHVQYVIGSIAIFQYW
jgi:hypothetical protein